MPEIIFNTNAGTQKAEFKDGLLTTDEYKLVESIVHWDNPEQHLPLIRALHGRSITFQSPSKSEEQSEDVVRGKYCGLQVFGAGGSRQAISKSVLDENKPFYIEPVNEANHTDELKKILQLRKINEEGELVMWQRPYAPLHGMDLKEAQSRKLMTSKLQMRLDPFQNRGEIGPFIVPELAAEGFFPEKIDPFGNPLQFQVYRVPLLDRFPNQFIRKSVNQGFKAGHYFLADFAYRAGLFFRILNENNLAYMDGYFGNMSLVEHQNRKVLFATDLGSIEDISQSKFQDRYRGFDIYMYLYSLNEVVDTHKKILQKVKLPDNDIAQIIHELRVNGSSAFIEGYFRPELKSMVEKCSSQDEVSQIIVQKNRNLNIGFFENRPQGFIEFFEDYFRNFQKLE